MKLKATSIKKYFDNFSNVATIEKKQIIPYKGSTRKEQAYILKCYAAYDHNQLYFCAIYETEKKAQEQLQKFSCATFKLCK